MTELQQIIQDVYNKINNQEYNLLTDKEKDVLNLCLIKMFELHSINNQIMELSKSHSEEDIRLAEKKRETIIHFLTEMNELI